MERKGNCLVSLKPIKNKIQNWITYEENKPRIPYEQNCEVHHRYRSTHDLDCVLLGGDLRADNIISLWLPLRYCLVEINGYPTLNKYGIFALRRVILLRSDIRLKPSDIGLLPALWRI